MTTLMQCDACGGEAIVGYCEEHSDEIAATIRDARAEIEQLKKRVQELEAFLAPFKDGEWDESE